MTILENKSVKSLHTFRCDVQARYFTTITKAEDVIECIQWSHHTNVPFMVIGGGSNLLFIQDTPTLIAKMEIMGIKKITESSTEVILSVGAGENWHHFVTYCIQKGWSGIENLSLIPGTVGAAPIQNIGAYGVEVQELIHSVTAYDIPNAQWVELSKSECVFEYRSSLFKKQKNRYIITEVQFTLQKQAQPKLEYGAIREVLHNKGIKYPNLSNIAEAIIQIRTSKLPDTKKFGNAGSFFKNPSISKEQTEVLKKQFPSIVAYPISDNTYKISAGWLIEACEWKGVRKGQVGCYDKQALVIINYGNATGKEIFDFSEEIVQTVHNKFGIILEREVNIV